MKTIVLVLLGVWLLVAVLGAVVEGLLWLLFIGLVLFAATALWGFLKMRSGTGAGHTG